MASMRPPPICERGPASAFEGETRTTPSAGMPSTTDELDGSRTAAANVSIVMTPPPGRGSPPSGDRSSAAPAAVVATIVLAYMRSAAGTGVRPSVVAVGRPGVTLRSCPAPLSLPARSSNEPGSTASEPGALPGRPPGGPPPAPRSLEAPDPETDSTANAAAGRRGAPIVSAPKSDASTPATGSSNTTTASEALTIVSDMADGPCASSTGAAAAPPNVERAPSSGRRETSMRPAASGGSGAPPPSSSVCTAVPAPRTASTPREPPGARTTPEYEAALALTGASYTTRTSRGPVTAAETSEALATPAAMPTRTADAAASGAPNSPGTAPSDTLSRRGPSHVCASTAARLCPSVSAITGAAVSAPRDATAAPSSRTGSDRMPAPYSTSPDASISDESALRSRESPRSPVRRSSDGGASSDRGSAPGATTYTAEPPAPRPAPGSSPASTWTVPSEVDAARALAGPGTGTVAASAGPRSARRSYTSIDERSSRAAYSRPRA